MCQKVETSSAISYEVFFCYVSYQLPPALAAGKVGSPYL